jgi:outer membrane protein TolC
MKLSHLLPIALVALAACTSVDARRELDLLRVSNDVIARTGFEIDARSAKEARERLETPFGPSDAVRVALALDPQVQAHMAELGAASAARVQAGLLRNPLLQLIATSFSNGTDLDIGLSQPLLDVFALDARRATAEARLDAARARTARELVRLVFDVRRAWFEAQFDERALEVVRERLVAEDAANRLANELHEAGNVTDGFLAESERGAAAARTELVEAERRARASREFLAQRMGVPASAAELRLSLDASAAELPELPKVDLVDAGLHASLELREQRAETAALARRAGIADWSAWLDRSAAGIASRREGGRDGGGASLSVPLPLFDTGVVARAAAEFELEASVARLERRELDVAGSARRLQADYESRRARAGLERDERLPVARRAVHAALQQYNAMQIGVFDVLEARRDELDTAIDALESEREAQHALLQIEEFLAGSLPAERTNSELATRPSLAATDHR